VSPGSPLGRRSLLRGAVESVKFVRVSTRASQKPGKSREQAETLSFAVVQKLGLGADLIAVQHLLPRVTIILVVRTIGP